MPKDACYKKVKARYKVFPSAYASGAIAKCRKKGAKNWGNSKKKPVKKAMGGVIEPSNEFRKRPVRRMISGGAVVKFCQIEEKLQSIHNGCKKNKKRCCFKALV